MLSYAVTAHDSMAAASACNTCCCQDAIAWPGSTEQWRVSYLPWVAGIGGRGLIAAPTFDIQLQTPVIAGGNQPPTNTDYIYATASNTPLNGNVAANAIDPEGATMTYALLPIYKPVFGALVFNANGTFTYTPGLGYVGYDSFWFSTTDGVNTPIVRQVQIVTQPLAPLAPLPLPNAVPVLAVPVTSVQIDPAMLSFALAATPAAKIGDIYQLTIRAPAMSCVQQFVRNDCWTIQIGKC